MKVKVVIGTLLAVAVLGFILQGSNKDSLVDQEDRQKRKEPVEFEAEVEKEAIESEDFRDQKEEAVVQIDENQLSPLEKLHKKVDGLSMFNQRGLDELRAEAYEWMDKNPKEFEEFTLGQVKNSDKNSIESMFFFVEAYAKKHPNPAEGINEILKMEAHKEDPKKGHVEMGGKQKQNMAKAFALEAYFNRLEKNSSGPSEGIAKIEETVKELVEKESDLMMVRQGLQVLRNNLDYDQEQLKEIIESRPNSANEGHAVSDILAE